MKQKIFLILIGFWLIPAFAWAEGVRVRASTGGYLVIDKGLLERIILPSTPISGRRPDSLLETAENIASENGLPPNLVTSLIRAESNGNPDAVSPKGAAGLMQLMPDTARVYGASNPFDPVANIQAGVRYLKDLLHEFSGSLSLALAAYNAGPGAVREYQGIPPYPETREFVRKVKDGYRAGEDLSQRFVFPPRGKGVNPPEKVPGKIYLTGSPRDLAVFLKKMR